MIRFTRNGGTTSTNSGSAARKRPSSDGSRFTSTATPLARSWTTRNWSLTCSESLDEPLYKSLTASFGRGLCRDFLAGGLAHRPSLRRQRTPGFTWIDFERPIDLHTISAAQLLVAFHKSAPDADGAVGQVPVGECVSQGRTCDRILDSRVIFDGHCHQLLPLRQRENDFNAQRLA